MYNTLFSLCWEYPITVSILVLSIVVFYYEQEYEHHHHNEMSNHSHTPSKRDRDSSPESFKVRILQWNVLADGLGTDGFLSTAFTPIHESSGKASFSTRDFMKLVQDAKQADESSGMIDTMNSLKKNQKTLGKLEKQKASKDEIAKQQKICNDLDAKIQSQSKLVQLKQRFDKSPELLKVDTEILAWEKRFPKIQKLLLEAQPDIVTLQEIDHVQDLLLDPELSKVYTCLLSPNDAKYQPANYDPKDSTKDDLRRSNYVNDILKSKTAFAPKAYSNARKFHSKRSKNPAEVIEDDGVAIFWKKSRFQGVSMGVLQLGTDDATDEKSEAILAVTLQDIATKQTIQVLTTHLPSGDEAKKEAERLETLKSTTKKGIAGWISAQTSSPQDYPVTLQDGVLSFVQHHLESGIPTILALDANSRPTFPLIPSTHNSNVTTNVWKELRGLSSKGRWESVWVQDGWLEASTGKSKSIPFVVSVNKMRGPSSQQPSKIGEHQLELIDHVYTTAQEVRLVRQVGARTKVAPLEYASKEEAALELLPNLGLPSDHLPVVVDCAFGTDH